MRFSLSPDQELFKRNFREVLERCCTPAHVRAAWHANGEAASQRWSELAAFGVLGVLGPEALGGLSLSDVEATLLLEEAGRAALPEPLLETAAVAVPVLSALASDARASALSGAVISGTVAIGVGLSSESYVTLPPRAEQLLVETGEEAHLVSLSESEPVLQPSVDGSRRLFRVAPRLGDSTRLARGKLVQAAFDEARVRGRIGAAAELVGLGLRVVDMTVAHAKTRVQFGQPIGAFQAVKHQLAEAFKGLVFARPLVYRAAHSMANGDPERALHASVAKAGASDAAYRASRVALQVHGAIGYSYEHDLHLWMKRIWSLARAWGDAAFHRARIAHRLLGT